MRKYLAIIAATLFLLALPAQAEEELLITATAATATQYSSVFDVPPWAKGMVLLFDVTAGSTLLLDVNVEGYSGTLNKYGSWYLNCPSNGGVTGVSTTWCLYYPHNTSEVAIGVNIVPMLTQFRAYVHHGNTNAATYTVHVLWIW